MTDHNKPSSLISVGCETVSACGSSTPPTGTWGAPSTGACSMTRPPFGDHLVEVVAESVNAVRILFQHC